MNDSVIYKFELSFQDADKNELFKYDAVGRYYDIIDNQTIILIEIKDNQIANTMTTFKYDYYGSTNTVKAIMNFAEFGPQNLVFPPDLDTWPLLKN